MSDYFEDQRPTSQDLIVTSNVTAFLKYIGVVRESARYHALMGLVTARSGSGKTSVVDWYTAQQSVRQDSELPEVVRITIPYRATGKQVAMEIGQALADTFKARNIYDAQREAALSIQRNDVKLILVDEADSLNDDSFETLRAIYDSTGCSIVLVGLPKITAVIKSKEKFRTRMLPPLQFQPLGKDEIFQVVLPQMVFPRWQFQGDREVDQQLGDLIWKAARSNLRTIRTILGTASIFAGKLNIDAITPEIIEAAARLPITGPAEAWYESHEPDNG